MRHLLTLFTAMLAFMSSSIASGVTQDVKLTNSSSAMVSVTTVAAAKAQTEVQIRRLHSLLVSKSGNIRDVEDYQRMQRRLRGAK